MRWRPVTNRLSGRWLCVGMQDRKSTSRAPLLLAGLATALGGLTGACGFRASPAASPITASQGDLAYYSKESFASVNVIDWSGELQNVIQLP